MPDAIPKPNIGQPLPRAADAYSTPEKWDQWILADRGHGQEWARVFRVDPADIERVWQAILKAMLDAQVHKVVDHGQDGIVCGVDSQLTIGSRTAWVRTSWHYEHAASAPRLVTAYPRL
jgi:hypothetical protein